MLSERGVLRELEPVVSLRSTTGYKRMRDNPQITTAARRPVIHCGHRAIDLRPDGAK